jgi:hypothetical protein
MYYIEQTGSKLSYLQKFLHAKSPVADNAFPMRLASLPKQRKSIISHRAS